MNYHRWLEEVKNGSRGPARTNREPVIGRPAEAEQAAEAAPKDGNKAEEQELRKAA